MQFTTDQSPGKFLTIITLVFSFFAVICNFALTGLIRQDDPYTFLQEHKQLYEDWLEKPYVDIVVMNAANGCPLNYEPLFNRTWNGTHDVCRTALYRNAELAI